jgi:hypothetical protein
MDQECDRLSTCEFFNRFLNQLPVVTQMYLKNYCLKDNSKCARLAVFEALGKGGVPSQLRPDQHDQATTIIENARKAS